MKLREFIKEIRYLFGKIGYNGFTNTSFNERNQFEEDKERFMLNQIFSGLKKEKK